MKKTFIKTEDAQGEGGEAEGLEDLEDITPANQKVELGYDRTVDLKKCVLQQNYMEHDLDAEKTKVGRPETSERFNLTLD